MSIPQYGTSFRKLTIWIEPIQNVFGQASYADVQQQLTDFIATRSDDVLPQQTQVDMA